MVQVICDKCGSNCDKHTIVLNVQHISNYSTHTSDIGKNTMGDVVAEYKICLCQQCNGEMGLPNPYNRLIPVKEEDI